MNALDIYLDQINARRALFGLGPLDPYADYVELRTEVEALGSPEILSGDGEYPLEESRRRTDEWLDAMDKLVRIGEELMN